MASSKTGTLESLGNPDYLRSKAAEERVHMSGEAMGRRVAIVTGGAQGIGAATARRLAADGFDVAVVDLADSAADAVSEIISAGGRAVAVRVDVGDTAAGEQAVEHTVEVFGPPTVLVNCAGLTRDNLLVRMSDEDWDVVQRVHVRGTFVMCRAVAGHMTEAGWGRIVNVSSVAAKGSRGQANYAAAKAAIHGFTRTLALELGRYGVTVNAVSPGFVATAMTDATARRLGMEPEQLRAKAALDIAVRRVGQPNDVAHAVAFLIGEEASFVSGHVLTVAGGPE